MALYLVHRPKGAEHLRNTPGLHGALVDAVSAPAALLAANALAPDLNTPFAGFTAVLVAATAQGGFVPSVFDGDVLGAAYNGARKGA